MGNLEFVDGCGWISDDSSFYGDEDSKQQLEKFNPNTWDDSRKNNLNAIIEMKKEKELEFAAQNHPVPPLSSNRTTWVHNPKATLSTRDEADLINRGMKLLDASDEKRREIESSGDGYTVNKQLHIEGKLLQQRIINLATETNVLHGKWMLFPEEDTVAQVWPIVFKAVSNDELGPAAKVAPKDGSKRSRLICIYTKDFRDHDDVLRVLRRLVSLGLVSSKQSIYYKTDAYTWLGIYHQTAASHGLEASLYCSRTMLKDAEAKKSK